MTESEKTELETVAADLYRNHDVPPRKDSRSYSYRNGWRDGVHHAAKVVERAARTQSGVTLAADREIGKPDQYVCCEIALDCLSHHQPDGLRAKVVVTMEDLSQWTEDALTQGENPSRYIHHVLLAALSTPPLPVQANRPGGGGPWLSR